MDGNNRIAKKIRQGLIGGIVAAKSLKDDASEVWQRLVSETVEIFADSRVPNEELHYNKEYDPKAKKEAESPVQLDKSDETLKMLCGFSDEEFEELKAKLAQAETMRRGNV